MELVDYASKRGTLPEVQDLVAKALAEAGPMGRRGLRNGLDADGGRLVELMGRLGCLPPSHWLGCFQPFAAGVVMDSMGFPPGTDCQQDKNTRWTAVPFQKGHSFEQCWME